MLALLVIAVALAVTAWSNPGTCFEVTQGQKISFMDTLTKRLEDSHVPGKYTGAEERLEKTRHPGGLQGRRIFSNEAFRSGGNWPHTKPGRAFQGKEDLEEAKEAIAWLLRRGMSSLLDDVQELLEGFVLNDAEMGHLASLFSRAISSYEQFWDQSNWALTYGQRQVEWQREWKEYGPETNFWLKFRPTLSCQHMPRIGPEIGGAKVWCNPRFMEVTDVLSAGAGDDFIYEHIVADLFSTSHLNITTTDCYQYDEEHEVPFHESATIRVLPVCLGDGHSDSEYLQLVPPQIRHKFISLTTMMRQRGGKPFHLIKCNIEASEYPMFAEAFQHAEKNFGSTQQINIETHRMGMHENGLDFSSLAFMELLFATFYSGGFHPVFIEKWHDRNAAQDVVFVNQRFWLRSEIESLQLCSRFPVDGAVVMEWSTTGWQLYAGAKSPQALVEHIKAENTRSREVQLSLGQQSMLDMFSGEPKKRGRGTLRPMAVEYIDSLSVADFVRIYAEPGIPVVLKQRTSTEINFELLRQYCDTSGTVHVFESGSGSGWAGFNFDNKQEMTLAQFMDRASGTSAYGFDYEAMCSCSMLLDKFPPLRYFQGDVLTTDEGIPRVHWPVVIAGNAGSASALHVDAGMLPFWMHVLGGKKLFRVVLASDWKSQLQEFYDAQGNIIVPHDVFENAEPFLRAGASVYTATLHPSDVIYVPVAALHGARNLKDETIALSANFLDEQHAAAVWKEGCISANSQICQRLERDADGLFRDMEERVRAVGKGSTYDFWKWVLRTPGFCEKNRYTCTQARERCDR
eukprot:g2297.t1